MFAHHMGPLTVAIAFGTIVYLLGSVSLWILSPEPRPYAHHAYDVVLRVSPDQAFLMGTNLQSQELGVDPGQSQATSHEPQLWMP